MQQQLPDFTTTQQQQVPGGQQQSSSAQPNACPPSLSFAEQLQENIAALLALSSANGSQQQHQSNPNINNSGGLGRSASCEAQPTAFQKLLMSATNPHAHTSIAGGNSSYVDHSFGFHNNNDNHQSIRGNNVNNSNDNNYNSNITNNSTLPHHTPTPYDILLHNEPLMKLLNSRRNFDPVVGNNSSSIHESIMPSSHQHHMHQQHHQRPHHPNRSLNASQRFTNNSSATAIAGGAMHNVNTTTLTIDELMTSAAASSMSLAPTTNDNRPSSNVQWLFDAAAKVQALGTQPSTTTSTTTTSSPFLPGSRLIPASASVQPNSTAGTTATMDPYASMNGISCVKGPCSPAMDMSPRRRGEWKFDGVEDLFDEEYLFSREEMLRRRNPRYLAQSRRLFDLHIVMPICVPNGSIVVDDPLGANYYKFDAELDENIGAHILFGKGVAQQQQPKRPSTASNYILTTSSSTGRRPSAPVDQTLSAVAASTAAADPVDAIPAAAADTDATPATASAAAAADTDATPATASAADADATPAAAAAAECTSATAAVAATETVADQNDHHNNKATDSTLTQPEMSPQLLSSQPETQLPSTTATSTTETRASSSAAATATAATAASAPPRRCPVPACDVWASFLHIRLGSIYNLNESQMKVVVDKFNSCFDKHLCYFYRPVSLDCRGIYPSTDDMISQRVGRPTDMMRDAKDGRRSANERYETRGALTADNDVRRLRMIKRHLKSFALDLINNLGFNGAPSGGDLMSYSQLPMPCIELHDNFRNSTLLRGSLKIVIREWSKLEDPEVFKKVWNGKLSSSTLATPNGNMDVAEAFMSRFLEHKDIPSARVLLGEIRLEHNHLRMVDPRWPEQLVLGRRVADPWPQLEAPRPEEIPARFVFCSKLPKPTVVYSYSSSPDDPREDALASRLSPLFRAHLVKHPAAGMQKAPTAESSAADNTVVPAAAAPAAAPAAAAVSGSLAAAPADEVTAGMKEKESETTAATEAPADEEKTTEQTSSSSSNQTTTVMAAAAAKMMAELESTPPQAEQPQQQQQLNTIERLMAKASETVAFLADRNAFISDYAGNYSTVPCKFYMKSGCARGVSCRFLHPADMSLESKADIRQIVPKHPKFF